MIPQVTDLRDISRNADRCLTEVTLYPDWDPSNRIRWLISGASALRYSEPLRQHTLTSYLVEGVTDFEHDSAYALGLPLVGLRFDNLFYHRTSFTAWVDPNDPESFRVPRPGYNPMKLKDAHRCKSKHCEKSHIIVPEGHYYPPFDEELYEAVKGKRVQIEIGVANGDV